MVIMKEINNWPTLVQTTNNSEKRKCSVKFFIKKWTHIVYKFILGEPGEHSSKNGTKSSHTGRRSQQTTHRSGATEAYDTETHSLH
jgi:hypothetical protein